jgi:vancomycin resistance protein VanW
MGGGLCQLSGIVYEAGLRAGLDPAERHPHSRDLYARRTASRRWGSMPRWCGPTRICGWPMA